MDDPGPWLILAELHSYCDPDLPLTLLKRHALLVNRHRKPASCVVVLLRPEANSPALTGTLVVRNPLGRDWTFESAVIRLWELPPETFLNGPLALLPFAPLAKVSPDDAPRVTQRIQERFEAEATPADRDWFTTALFELLALRYDKSGILVWRDLMATHDISKTYLAEMFRAEGRTEGRTEGVRDSILTIGSARFGAPPAEVLAALNSITDFDLLHRRLDRLFTAQSWQELLAPDPS